MCGPTELIVLIHPPGPNAIGPTSSQKANPSSRFKLSIHWAQLLPERNILLCGRKNGASFPVSQNFSICQGTSSLFPWGLPLPWGVFPLGVSFLIPWKAMFWRYLQCLSASFEVLKHDFKLMLFIVKIYMLFLGFWSDFSSTLSSYFIRAAIICWKKWRGNKLRLDLVLTMGCCHRPHFMLSRWSNHPFPISLLIQLLSDSLSYLISIVSVWSAYVWI